VSERGFTSYSTHNTSFRGTINASNDSWIKFRCDNVA